MKWFEEKAIDHIDEEEVKERYRSFGNQFIFNESVKNIEDVKTPDDLMSWMKKSILYSHESHFKSYKEVLDTLKGDCHDQTEFESHYFRKMNIKYGKLFIIEYKDWNHPGGSTHSLLYFYKNNKLYRFENAWEDEYGIHGPYKEIDELKDDICKRWKFSGNFDKLLITSVKGVKPGMSLNEYVNACLSNVTEKTKPYYQKETIMNETTERLPSELIDVFYEKLKSRLNENTTTESVKGIFNKSSKMNISEPSCMKNYVNGFYKSGNMFFPSLAGHCAEITSKKELDSCKESLKEIDGEQPIKCIGHEYFIEYYHQINSQKLLELINNEKDKAKNYSANNFDSDEDISVLLHNDSDDIVYRHKDKYIYQIEDEEGKAYKLCTLDAFLNISKSCYSDIKTILQYKEKIIEQKSVTESVQASDTKAYLLKYKTKLKNLEMLTGEKRIARMAEDPKDLSIYQKFQKNDNVRNDFDIKSFINEKTFLISDLHFGKYGKIYDNKNIDLINKIPKDSVLLILGDIGYIKTSCSDYIADCFSRIHCENIFLILGNHDCYDLDFYYDKLGIKGIYERIYIPEKNWLFTHQPADGKHGGIINFHGHIHEETYYTRVKDVKLKINCWEGYCNGKPKTVKEWKEENEKYPKQKEIIEINKVYTEDIDLISENEDFFEDFILEAVGNGTMLRDTIYPYVENTFKGNPANVRKFNQLVSNFINRNIEKLTTSGPVYLIPFTDRDKSDYYTLFGITEKEIKKVIKDHTKSLNSASNFLLLTQNPIFVLFYFVIRYFTLNPDNKSLNSALSIYALSAYPSIFTKYFPKGVIEPVMRYTIDNLTDKFLIKKSKHVFGVLVESMQRSYKFLKPYMKDATDKEVIRFIQRIRNDHNSLFKKISNMYMQNHKNGYAISTTNTTYDDNTPIVDEINNATTEVQNAVLKVSMPIISNGVDIIRAEASAKMSGIGVSDCRFFLTNIMIDKNIDQLQEMIESILFLYLYEDKKTIRDIRSQYFLAWAASLFKKTNSKNDNILRINKILNHWAEESGIYAKFRREASRINYKKALFFYVILSIQKYI